jgi:hypothetical protein
VTTNIHNASKITSFFMQQTNNFSVLQIDSINIIYTIHYKDFFVKYTYRTHCFNCFIKNANNLSYKKVHSQHVDYTMKLKARRGVKIIVFILHYLHLNRHYPHPYYMDINYNRNE